MNGQGYACDTVTVSLNVNDLLSCVEIIHILRNDRDVIGCAIVERDHSAAWVACNDGKPQFKGVYGCRNVCFNCLFVLLIWHKPEKICWPQFIPLVNTFFGCHCNGFLRMHFLFVLCTKKIIWQRKYMADFPFNLFDFFAERLQVSRVEMA